MARAFDFNTTTKNKARLRQDSLCAVCGENLDDMEEHAHHVIPNQSGDPRNAAHQWLGSTDNCVVLCALCHERVHENGKYRTGAVAPPTYYPHSHGNDKTAHRTWAATLSGRAKGVW